MVLHHYQHGWYRSPRTSDLATLIFAHAPCLCPASQDPERTKDPVEFVSRLLEERDKYERIVTSSFGDDKTFRNALNQVGGYGSAAGKMCV